MFKVVCNDTGSLRRSDEDQGSPKVGDKVNIDGKVYSITSLSTPKKGQTRNACLYMGKQGLILTIGKEVSYSYEA